MLLRFFRFLISVVRCVFRTVHPKNKQICPTYKKDKRWKGAEYLNITKDRLVYASAPYAPHERYVHQGQKHTIQNFNLEKGICSDEAYAPSYLIYQGICPLCPTA